MKRIPVFQGRIVASQNPVPSAIRNKVREKPMVLGEQMIFCSHARLPCRQGLPDKEQFAFLIPIFTANHYGQRVRPLRRAFAPRLMANSLAQSMRATMRQRSRSPQANNKVYLPNKYICTPTRSSTNISGEESDYETCCSCERHRQTGTSSSQIRNKFLYYQKSYLQLANKINDTAMSP